MKTLDRILAGALLCAGCAVPAYGQIQTAGTLLVNMDPSGLAAGPVSWVTNSGSVGGVFQATGLATVNQPVIVNVGGGTVGVMFDGNNFMEHVTAVGGTKLNLPTALSGANMPCSIECWVNNSTTWDNDGETMVYWGVRGTGGYHMAFCYSGNGDHGATDHWGYNLGWATVPTMGLWHHLVYTFDGTTQKIYADGVLQRTGTAVYNPIAAQPITLAAQRNSDGTLVGGGGVRGSLTLGKVRIHSAPLSDTQVAANYNAEKGAFVTAPTPLAAKPIHRYTFNNAATNDAVGLTVPDLGTAPGADAVIQGIYGTTSASFANGKIRLSGGTPDVSPYVDLPNRMISSLSSSNGGTGKLTVEGWLVVTGGRAWPRLFDFGNSASGEMTGPGGSGEGASYFALMQVNTYRDWHQCEVNNRFGYNGAATNGNARGFGLANNNNAGLGMKHYAVTWDEASGEIVVYVNGVEATRFITTHKFNQIDDVNVWLGRSNWLGDNNLQGDYDEFRVYNYVLSPAEVQNNYQGGADVVGVTPGPLQALHLQLPRPTTMAGTFEQLTVMGDFLNVSNLNITTKGGLTFSSDNAAVATVSTNGLVQALSAGSAVLTVSMDGKSASQTLTVTAVSAPLAHRYSFNTTPDWITTPDSVGGTAWDATMVGSYIMDNQLNLDGANGFATLPPGVVSNLDSLTIEAWASFGTLGNWCELYGFGNQLANGEGRNYMMMTPHSGSGDTRISIADSPTGDNHEQAVVIPGVLDNQTNVHIAAVYHPYAGYIALYLNGALAGINTNITIPLSSVIDNTNLLGYSIWAADSHINGTLNEFRVYSGPRTSQQIAVDAAAGPDNLLDSAGTLQSVHLAVTNQMIVNLTQQAKVTGDFSGIAGVNLFGYGQPVLVSGNTSILTVTPTGLVKAVGPGTTTLTATYGTFTDSKSVTVSIPAPVLAHRYSFNEAPDSWTVSDLVGGVNWNGTLPNGGTFTGTQLVLDSATGQHVALPAGLIKGYYALTIETWASFRANNGWCRLWDFGDQRTDLSGNTSVFFSPHDGDNRVQATIFNPSATDRAQAPGNLDNQTNVHIVAVYDPYSSDLRLYLNGRLAARNSNASVLLSTINDLNCWIGRSMFQADAYLNGSIDEFRVYNGVLSPAQVAINDAAGATTVVSDPGALQTVRFLLNTAMLVDQTQQAQLLGDFANVTGVNLFFYDAPSLSSSDTNVVTVTPDGQVHAVGVGQATLTAVFNGTSYTKLVAVQATSLALKHRYTFNDPIESTAAADVVGGANALLQPGAVFDGAGQMVLDGTNGYAALPMGILSSLSNCTLEVWVTPTSSGNWQRILDFGIDDGAGVGSNYLFIASRGAPGMRFTVTTNGGGAAESPVLNAPTPLFVGQESYVAVTYNVSAGVSSLYQDGALVASGPIAYPLSSLMDTNNWLGRSQYSVDSLFAGTYNEFRIYEGSLTPGEIGASYRIGPGSLPYPKVQARTVGSNLEIAWPNWATRYSLQSSPVLGAGASWTPVTATPSNNGSAYTVTLPASGSPRFYRLSN